MFLLFLVFSKWLFLENKKILFSLFFFYSLDDGNNNNNKRHHRTVVLCVFFFPFSPFPNCGFSSIMKQSKTFFFILTYWIHFIFVCFEIWIFFFGMGCGNHFSILLFERDLSFFILSNIFCFLIFPVWMLRKLGKEKKKNLIRVGFFLGCFVQRNKTEYSSMLLVRKIKKFCFTDRKA